MIRPAQWNEIDQIMAITRACAQKMNAHGIYQWNEQYPSREAFEADLARNELYVLLEKEMVIACIVLSSYMDQEYESVSWLTEDSNNYYVHRLAVHPNFQGRGFARKLMDFAEDCVRKKDGISVRLDTFSQNHRNQRFYEGRGYCRLGNIYFPKQSDAPFYCYELVLS